MEYAHYNLGEIANYNTEQLNIDNPNKRKNSDDDNNSQPPKKFKSNSNTSTPIHLLCKNNNCNENNKVADINNGNDSNVKLECNNPLCDHQNLTRQERANRRGSIGENKVAEKAKEIKTIDDLIELGKSFHCKKNTSYYGINLRVLCNLVPPLVKLKNMVGMQSVKENIVNQIVFFLQGFNRKENCKQCMDCVCNLPCTKNFNNDMLHTVITGSPGTGKTELGKILGQVYKAMGILSKGHINIATRSDLVGKFLGHTAHKTQEFINKCSGGVMFIDEAYALGNREQRDSFSKECLDTLNQNLTEKRDFLCIIAGYADALEECFFNTNEGLKRRFTYRYDIEEYTPIELTEIFLMKIKSEGWKMEFDLDANDITHDKMLFKNKLFSFFKRNKKYFPYFGGDIESFILNVKVVHSKRTLFLNNEHKKVLNMYDIEEGFKVYIFHRKYNDSVDIDNLESPYDF